jgi:DNA-binding LytR/AlgR family response regulator
MIYTYLVIDDEPLARKLILSHAAKVDILQCLGEFGNAVEARNYLFNHSVDLIFLDIRMPEMDGLTFVSTLKKTPAVILTTAFREFAPEAFDLEVTDYLLKPISFDRFLKGVNKFLTKRAGDGAISHAEKTPETIFFNVRADRKVNKIRQDEILFIESLDDYIRIHTTGKSIVSRENISSVESKLRHYGFVRIHRSFIVARSHVSSISNEGVDVAGKTLPFGRTFKHAALAELGVKP